MKVRTKRRPVQNTRRPVLRVDPTRSVMLRRRFAVELRRRFARLKLKVVNLVLGEDAFGLKPRPTLLVNERWAYHSDNDKVRAFRDWLRTQIDQDISDEALWHRYVQEGFAKGAARAFDDVRPKPFIHERALFHDGEKREFLRTSLGRPVAVEKVKLLVSRGFDDLDDVTGTMANRMVRHLADGLVQGKGPREIAREMAGDIDGIGYRRAETIARTEIIRAHAEGQIQALEDLGVEELGVQVEWATSGLGETALGNPSPCELCAPMEGRVFTLEEARGLIPFHPN